MKKIIYYVVQKKLESVAGFEETTGNKTVTTYNVEDGKIVEFFQLDLSNEDNTIESIIDYLVDNGYAEESDDISYKPYYDEFNFVEL